MTAVWSVPRDWCGRRVWILGGGPSMALVDVAKIPREDRIIAVNWSFRLRPDADMLFFGDGGERFFGWAREAIAGEWRGGEIVTRAHVTLGDTRGLTVRRLTWLLSGEWLRANRGILPPALSRDPTAISGVCSGGNAINIAALRGAATVVLCGFDMRPGNWHSLHKRSAPPQRVHDFIRALREMAPELAADGVEVLNASPNSALHCFPIVHPRELLTEVA